MEKFEHARAEFKKELEYYTSRNDLKVNVPNLFAEGTNLPDFETLNRSVLAGAIVFLDNGGNDYLESKANVQTTKNLEYILDHFLATPPSSKRKYKDLTKEQIKAEREKAYKIDIIRYMRTINLYRQNLLTQVGRGSVMAKPESQGISI